MNIQACAVCGGSRFRPWHAGCRQCRECGFIESLHRPGAEELATLYDRTYFFGAGYADYDIETPAIRRNHQARLRLLANFLDRQRHRRLLEIGCAYGDFLGQAAGMFDEVVGIDLCADAVSHCPRAPRLSAITGDALTARLPHDTYDVICLWDTIEHLCSPEVLCRRFRDLTRPGALLALTTGDIASRNALWRGPRWRLLQPPAHLSYFSPATLRQLLDRSGFDVLYCRPHAVWRHAFFAAHKLTGGRWPRLLRCLYQWRLLDFSFRLDLGDILLVIARRR